MFLPDALVTVARLYHIAMVNNFSSSEVVHTRWQGAREAGIERKRFGDQ